MTDETTTETSEGMSLEDVYQKYDIQPKEETPPPQSDTYDAPASDTDQPHLATEIQKLQKTIAQQQRQIDEAEQRRLREQESHDLDQAVDYVRKQVKPANKEQEKLIKYAMAEKYESDKKFAAAWDNREKDPRAFSAVLEAAIPDFREAFKIKDVDQIAANQLALDNAVKGSGQEAFSTGSAHQKLLEMSDGDFEREWNRMMNQGF